MWCPQCGAEHRPEFSRCASCDVELIDHKPEGPLPEGAEWPRTTGPLTGRSVQDELQATGPYIAGSFVTMEEAHAALRALSEQGINADVFQKDTQYPMTLNRAEPAFAVSVQAPDLQRAQEILKDRGLVPTAIGRYAREEDAHAALAILEEKGLKPRISQIVMEDVPDEFRADVEPYVLEVPADQEMAANKALEGTVMKICESCGGRILFGDEACKGCGERVLY